MISLLFPFSLGFHVVNRFLFTVMKYVYFFKLYETLHVGEHHVKKERDMYARLEQINTELLPLEKVFNIYD